jgi:hypothetical protein
LYFFVLNHFAVGRTLTISTEKAGQHNKAFSRHGQCGGDIKMFAKQVPQHYTY